MVYVRTDCIYFIDFEALNYLPMTIYSIHAFVQTLENTESIMCSVQLKKKDGEVIQRKTIMYFLKKIEG